MRNEETTTTTTNTGGPNRRQNGRSRGICVCELNCTELDQTRSFQAVSNLFAVLLVAMVFIVAGRFGGLDERQNRMQTYAKRAGGGRGCHGRRRRRAARRTMAANDCKLSLVVSCGRCRWRPVFFRVSRWPLGRPPHQSGGRRNPPNMRAPPSRRPCENPINGTQREPRRVCK